MAVQISQTFKQCRAYFELMKHKILATVKYFLLRKKDLYKRTYLALHYPVVPVWSPLVEKKISVLFDWVRRQGRILTPQGNVVPIVWFWFHLAWFCKWTGILVAITREEPVSGRLLLKWVNYFSWLNIVFSINTEEAVELLNVLYSFPSSNFILH